MSDKGFNVQGSFASRDATINIRTFKKKQNRMSGNTVLLDRKISSKRVHIESILAFAKTFKVLKGSLNSTKTKLASEIIFVCCFTLCLFWLVSIYSQIDADEFKSFKLFPSMTCCLFLIHEIEWCLINLKKINVILTILLIAPYSVHSIACF